MSYGSVHIELLVRHKKDPSIGPSTTLSQQLKLGSTSDAEWEKIWALQSVNGCSTPEPFNESSPEDSMKQIDLTNIASLPPACLFPPTHLIPKAKKVKKEIK